MATTRYHRHKCRNAECGFIWEHEDKPRGYFGGDPWSDEKRDANDEAHRCPKCRRLNYHKHFGPELCHASTRPLEVAHREFKYDPADEAPPSEPFVLYLMKIQCAEYREIYASDDAALLSQKESSR